MALGTDLKGIAYGQFSKCQSGKMVPDPGALSHLMCAVVLGSVRVITQRNRSSEMTCGAMCHVVAPSGGVDRTERRSAKRSAGETDSARRRAPLRGPGGPRPLRGLGAPGRHSHAKSGCGRGASQTQRRLTAPGSEKGVVVKGGRKNQAFSRRDLKRVCLNGVWKFSVFPTGISTVSFLFVASQSGDAAFS